MSWFHQIKFCEYFSSLTQTLAVPCPGFVFQGSLCLLQKAELLSSRGHPFLGDARLQARAVTLNNLGCLMKKWGKPHLGIAFLVRALRIEAKVPGGAINPAGTHLNMSAALNTVGMHRAAAIHAGHAINITSQALEQMDSITSQGTLNAGRVELGKSAIFSTGVDFNKSICRYHPSAFGVFGQGEKETSPPPYKVGDENVDKETTKDLTPPKNTDKGRVTPCTSVEGETTVEESESRSAAGGLLAIAYFNLAVEREHMGQLKAACCAYENANVVARLHLGPESQVSKGIGNALERATSAAHAVAVSGRQRAATRTAAACLPSIGKLRFSPRTLGCISDSSGPRVVRRSRPKGDLNNYLAAQAYASPRPCPPSRPAERAASPHQPSSQGSVEGSGPQRAGRWTGNVPPPRTEKVQSVDPCRICGKDGGLLWRAWACAELECSPREARQAQVAEWRLGHGQTDNPQELSPPPLWVEQQ